MLKHYINTVLYNSIIFDEFILKPGGGVSKFYKTVYKLEGVYNVILILLLWFLLPFSHQKYSKVTFDNLLVLELQKNAFACFEDDSLKKKYF